MNNVADALNNLNLKTASNTVYFLLTEIKYIINAINADLIIGFTVQSDTIIKMQQFLTCVDNITSADYLTYDSVEKTITLIFAIPSFPSGVQTFSLLRPPQFPSSNLSILDTYTVLTNYVSLTTYPVDVYTDITTLSTTMNNLITTLERIDLARKEDHGHGDNSDVVGSVDSIASEIYFNYFDSTTSNNFLSLSTTTPVTDFYYSGTMYYGNKPTLFVIVVSGTATVGAQITDITNSKTIATISAQSITSKTILSTMAFNSVPSNFALWEIQLIVTSGTAQIHSTYLRLR